MYRSDSVRNVECQILEDLSLEPEAFHTRLPTSHAGVPQASSMDYDMNGSSSRSSTVAEAQLQDLLHNAMQQVWLMLNCHQERYGVDKRIT